MLAPGTRIGPYEVTARLGAGGMGEVYRATDTNLKRQVALKVLPAAVAGDADRLARFQREAEVLAALNHPHIAAIYGLERDAGTTALVMELVEGPTLAERIAQGALPLDEALYLARQIAEALEGAHDQGIVHRDLKPANVKVRPDGTVKVLDFGLAKALDASGAPGAAAGQPGISQLPTVTTPAMTQAGVILGTAAYMSPEQARGKPVDIRTDLWAFGCVLFEMLAGRRAFDGDDVAGVLARVIEREPDWTALPAATPESIRRLLRRCLVKDRRRRLPNGVSAILELDEPSGAAPGISPAARPRWPALVATAAVALLASAAALAMWIRQPMGERLPVTLSILPPENVWLQGNSVPAVSPDGRAVAFVASNALWVRDLAVPDARKLAGTEGANLPFWSPDSRSIGFFAAGKLKRLDLADARVVSLCDAGGPGRGGTWNRDGVIVFSGNLFTPLSRVSATGGSPTRVTTLADGESAHRYPWFLPDGRRFLYTVMGVQPSLVVGDLSSPERRTIMPVQSNVVFASGHLLFQRDRQLMARAFDPVTLEASADDIQVAEDVTRISVDFRGAFGGSDAGVLAFGSPSGNPVRRLVWFDRSGAQVGTIETPDLNPTQPAIAPDGRAVVFDAGTGREGTALWRHDIASGVNTRLTFDVTTYFSPVWSADGRQIAYSKGGRIFLRKPDGSGGEVDLATQGLYASDWTRDGRQLVYMQLPREGQGIDVGTLPLSGDRTPAPLLASPSNELSGKLSPDGRWLSYLSNESGRQEVYVRAFTDGSGKWQVSQGGAFSAVWSRDGRELFYLTAEGRMMAVGVNARSDAAFSSGPARALFTVQRADFPSALPSAATGNVFDVAPNGRFLIPLPPEDRPATPVTVVLNWPALLRR
jgi:Tol biopolymer transport system component